MVGMTDAERVDFDKEYAVQLALSKVLHNAYYEAIMSGKVIVDSMGHDVPSSPEEIRKQVETGWGYWARVFEKDINKVKSAYAFHCMLSERYQHAMLAALDAPVEDERDWFKIDGNNDCYCCGETLYWRTNGRVIKPYVYVENPNPPVVPEGMWRPRLHSVCVPCKYSENKPKEYRNQILVPSGKVVMGNNLHGIFDDKLIFAENGAERWQNKFSLNHLEGQINYTKRYAEHGLLTGYLGSGSVQVFADSETIAIVRGDPDEEVENIGPLKYITNISLELWWYGVADFDKCKELNPEKTAEADDPAQKSPERWSYDNHEYFVLPLKPGRYEMQHFIENVDHERSGIQSVIRRIDNEG